MDDPDTSVLRALSDTHSAALWRYALRLTWDRARASDVVQETMLRAWQHPEVVPTPQRSARAWLFNVARTLIIDAQRSARFEDQTAAPEAGLPDWAGPDEINATLGSLRLLIGDALEQLPADQRAVVRCAYDQRRTTAQMAADFDIAEETVKSRLHHALRALWLSLRKMEVTR